MSPDKTGLGAMKPSIGLNNNSGPTNIARTRIEKVNPIRHLSNFGIGSPIGFK